MLTESELRELLRFISPTPSSVFTSTRTRPKGIRIYRLRLRNLLKG